MSTYDVMVPKNVGQLQESINMLVQNKSHVKSIAVDRSERAVLIKLDWMAHTKYNDMKIPVVESKLSIAEQIVNRMDSAVKSGHDPSSGDVQALFDTLEHATR